MEQKSILRKVLVGMVIALFSVPAMAQLSLSAKADAKADTKKGADASADADAEGDAASDESKTEEAEAEATEEADAEATEEATEEAAPPPPPPMPEPEEEMLPVDEPDTTGVTGYDGGFFVKTNDGNFKLKINGRVKARYDAYNDAYPVNDNGEPGTNHDQHHSFAVPYARVILAGHAFDPRLGYCLYWDISTNTLIYGWAKWAFMPGKLELKAGKFKRPMSRRYLTSSAKRGFIRGPIGDMGGALDEGIEVSNGFEKAKGLEWAAGVFNGSQGTGGDFSPVVTARIGYNNGIKGYDDVDFKGGPLRYGVGFSASTEFDHDDNGQTLHYLALDGMMKMNGLTLSAAGTLQSQAIDGFWDTDDDTSQSGLAAIGGYFQGGILLAEHFEPNWRYSFLHDFRIDEDLAHEITGGFTIHFFGPHGFKLLNSLTAFLNKETNGNGSDEDMFVDLLFSSQLEFNF